MARHIEQEVSLQKPNEFMSMLRTLQDISIGMKKSMDEGSLKVKEERFQNLLFSRLLTSQVREDSDHIIIKCWLLR